MTVGAQICIFRSLGRALVNPVGLLFTAGFESVLCVGFTRCAGADSVEYLTVEGLISAVQEGTASFQDCGKMVGHCTACLTGKYPVELEW